MYTCMFSQIARGLQDLMLHYRPNVSCKASIGKATIYMRARRTDHGNHKRRVDTIAEEKDLVAAIPPLNFTEFGRRS